MSDSEDEEKEHEPTQKKLDDARARGELVKSTDIMAAAGYAGFLIAGIGLGHLSLSSFGTDAMVLLDQADSLAPLLLGGQTGPVAGLLGHVLMIVSPWFLIPFICVLVSIFAQRALAFAPEKLAPKLSRISPISNAKQKFGPDGLFEFAKSFVKLVVISVILGMFLFRRLPQVLLSQHLTPAMGIGILLQLLVEFLLTVLAVAVVIGALDYLWQQHSHKRRLRMSRKEMIDEMKQNEGDPHVKQQRRQRGYDIAMNRMMTDVPKADVIIVNPTHYAVALKWERAGNRAPVCVAKGTDEIAARIREMAQEAGVPIQSDPPTARALYATVNIGREILPEHYQAVAAAIRFAEQMRKRAKDRGWK